MFYKTNIHKPQIFMREDEKEALYLLHMFLSTRQYVFVCASIRFNPGWWDFILNTKTEIAKQSDTIFGREVYDFWKIVKHKDS